MIKRKAKAPVLRSAPKTLVDEVQALYDRGVNEFTALNEREQTLEASLTKVRTNKAQTDRITTGLASLLNV